jgi:hypothetical protein
MTTRTTTLTRRILKPITVYTASGSAGVAMAASTATTSFSTDWIFHNLTVRFDEPMGETFELWLDANAGAGYDVQLDTVALTAACWYYFAPCEGPITLGKGDQLYSDWTGSGGWSLRVVGEEV